MMSNVNCPFCNSERDLVGSNDSAFAIRDAFPVSQGHTLIVPRTHESDLTALDVTSYGDCFDLVRSVVEELTEEFHPAGFNIGVNIGEAAGQTVDHAHIHVIPRYENDVPNPRGGVRGVIQGKADY